MQFTPRPVAAAVVLATAAAALTGCVASDPVVGLEDIKSATIQLEAHGTFVPIGTLDPVGFGGRGSGFLISGEGLAVTNNHVVTGAGTLEVWRGGSSESSTAQVLGASECLDLAVVRVSGSNLPHFGWYEGEIEAGLDVVAAGFPLGDPNFTVTKGIVSKADVPQEDSWASLDHVIEHDARIRGGNSGGPLVAENGRVVGVNYAGIDELDYNFAIHRDQVLPVIERLAKGERVLSLGLNLEAIAPTEEGEPLGVWVRSVQAGSPADDAGIIAGDVITDLGGVALAPEGTLEEYCDVLATQGVEATIDVDVYRPSENTTYRGQVNGDPIELVEAGAPADPDAPAPQTPGGFVTVTDSSGTVSVTVPAGWSETFGDPISIIGGQYLSITATPDLDGYMSGFEVPGVTVAATQDTSGGIQPALDAYADFSDVCATTEPGDYDDGLYAGQYLYFTGCGGTADFLLLSTMSADGSHLLLVTVQMLSDADKSENLQQILSSFQAAF
ncbi:S1C family serine protease [Schumannella luteola]